MERYFQPVKISRSKPDVKPYQIRGSAEDGRPSSGSRDVLQSIKSKDNPIAHCDAYKRAFHLVSCTTGHQQSNGRGGSGKGWAQSRYGKLKAQGAEAETNIFKGVSVYINGCTGNTTNLELIRLVQANGGHIKYTFGKTSVTHIITGMGLSGSKNQKEIEAVRNKTMIVRPEWVLDSIKAGQRLPESLYPVLARPNQPSVSAHFSSSHERPAGWAKTSVADMDDLEWLARQDAKSKVQKTLAMPTSAQR